MKNRFLRFVLGFGSLAKGIIYVALGLIALRVAFFRDGEPKSAGGVLLEIGSQPFGNLSLIVLFLGLLSYAIWRLTQSLFDPERLKTEPFGWWIRIWSGLIGAAHLWFAYQVINHVVRGWGLSSDERSSEQVQSWTSQALSWPAGRWLIGAAAITSFGFCIGQLIWAYRATYANAFDTNRTSALARNCMIWLGRVGFGARSSIAGIIGIFFLRAMLTRDPEEAGGVGDALGSLLQHSFGSWLLAAVALGLISFGVFFWGLSRFQAVDQKSKPPIDGRGEH